jgi:hypothetical protein
MDVAQKVFQMVLIMNNKTTEISRPGEQSLDFVTSAVSPLSLSHSEPPFLTTTNIPPMKNSLRSRWSCAQRSSASASSTLRKTPSRTQGLNPRWQIWRGGKRSGMSSRRAPLLKTQRAPLMTLPAFFPCDRPGRLGIQRSKSETTGLQPASRKIFQKQ